MNTKWLLIFILVLNAVMYMYSTQICASFNGDSIGTQVMDFFYDSGLLKSAYQQCRANLAAGITGPNSSAIMPTGGVIALASGNSTSQTFFYAANNTVTPNSGVVGAFVSNGLAFLDLIKMVAGFCIFMTGLPVPFMLAALNVPYFISYFIIIVVETLFVIGVLEFLRGSSF